MQLRRALTVLVLALIFLMVTAATAQQSAPLPTDPKAILQTLRDANGLDLHPTVPWHLQLSWNEFDNDGDNVHSGTIEEWYVSPHLYRIVFTGDSFNQTQIATDAGLFLSVPAQWPPLRAVEALEFVTTPLRRFDDEPRNARLETLTQQFGAV
jgi:hypothetical protein